MNPQLSSASSTPDWESAGRGGEFSPTVGKETQIAFSCDAGIQLPQRACSGIARVRIDRLFGRGLRLVKGLEGGLGHVDLAADLEDIRRAGWQGFRDVADRQDVGGDILTFSAITSGSCLYQFPAFIPDRSRQSVDFRLRIDGYFFALAQVRNRRTR